MMNKDETGSCCIAVSTMPISPEDTRDSSWNDDGHEEETPEVISVLPHDKGVVEEVRAIGKARFMAGTNDQPSNM